MNFVDKSRKQKPLSFILVLLTLSVGIVIGSLVTSGVKKSKDSTAVPGAIR
jgi:hypothetical protein